jgi:hypothetical protein
MVKAVKTTLDWWAGAGLEHVDGSELKDVPSKFVINEDLGFDFAGVGTED